MQEDASGISSRPTEDLLPEPPPILRRQPAHVSCIITCIGDCHLSDDARRKEQSLYNSLSSSEDKDLSDGITSSCIVPRDE